MNDDVPPKPTPLGKPPCGSCKKCCVGWQAVVLMPDMGDDPTQYKTALAGEVLLLAFKENGDCTYLGPDGCTIHDRAPVVCREFDCRGLFLQLTRPQRRELIKGRNMHPDIFDRGRELLPTLDDDGRAQALEMRRQGVGAAMLNSTNKFDKAMGKKKDGSVANVILGEPTND